MSDLELGYRQAASENSQEVDDSESIHAHSKPKDVDPKGYPSLARLMAETPELAIVRSFKELNILNVLRLQAELHELETRLERFREDDLRAGGDRENYYRDFYLMREAIGSANSPENEQYRVLLEISTKLGEYSTTQLTIRTGKSADLIDRRRADPIAKTSQGSSAFKVRPRSSQSVGIPA